VCQRSVRTREVSDKCPAGLRQLAFTGFSRSLRFDTLQHHRYRIARTKVFQRRFESHGRDKQCAVTPRTSRSHRIPCPPKCPDVVETSLLEQPRWQLCDHGSARFPLRSSTSYAAISTAIGTPNSTGQRCAYRAPATTGCNKWWGSSEAFHAASTEPRTCSPQTSVSFRMAYLKIRT